MGVENYQQEIINRESNERVDNYNNKNIKENIEEINEEDQELEKQIQKIKELTKQIENEEEREKILNNIKEIEKIIKDKNLLINEITTLNNNINNIIEWIRNGHPELENEIIQLEISGNYKNYWKILVELSKNLEGCDKELTVDEIKMKFKEKNIEELLAYSEEWKIVILSNLSKEYSQATIYRIGIMLWLSMKMCNIDPDWNFCYIENEKYCMIFNEWEIQWLRTIQDAIIRNLAIQNFWIWLTDGKKTIRIKENTWGALSNKALEYDKILSMSIIAEKRTINNNSYLINFWMNKNTINWWITAKIDNYYLWINWWLWWKDKNENYINLNLWCQIGKKTVTGWYKRQWTNNIIWFTLTRNF